MTHKLHYTNLMSLENKEKFEIVFCYESIFILMYLNVSTHMGGVKDLELLRPNV